MEPQPENPRSAGDVTISPFIILKGRKVPRGKRHTSQGPRQKVYKEHNGKMGCRAVSTESRMPGFYSSTATDIWDSYDHTKSSWLSVFPLSIVAGVAGL